jgi:hypothetical protein
LDEDIKQVRAAMRREGTDLNIRDLKRTEQALVKLRNEYLQSNNKGALQLLEDAERNTRRYHDFVDESVFAGVFKLTKDGRYVADNIAAFRHVFKNSPEAMRELYRIAGSHVGGREALQRTAYQMYKDEVAANGIPILKKHDAFVDKHYDVMQILFPDPEFIRFGRFARNIERIEHRASVVMDRLKNSPLAKLSGDSVTPESMARHVFDAKIGAEDIASVRRTLRGHSREALQAFDDAVGMQAWRKMSTEGVLSTTKLYNMINDPEARATLTAVFGDRYVGDLRRVLRGLNMARASTTAPRVGKTTPFGMALRAIITPPLTRRGRAQTLVETLRYDAVNEFLQQAVADPKLLRQLALQGAKDIRNDRVMAMFAQANAITAITQLDEPDFFTNENKE